MRFTFYTYWPLALPLIVLPYVWWVQKTDSHGPEHKETEVAVMGSFCGCDPVGDSADQPAFYRAGAWLSVIYLVDVSKSVSPGAVQSATQWIQQTNQTGIRTTPRFIPFARNSIQFETLDQLRNVQVTDEIVAGSIDQSGTNIEQAIDDALRSSPRTT